MSEKIRLRGVRTHNLKNIDLDILRNTLTVFTGLSGSGKSSLAFDTIFAEGHSRYMDSLSAYARQFLGQIEKPDLDRAEGLTPSIAIDQKTVSKSPRSTVGTITEIYDFLRVLFARLGTPHCPDHRVCIEPQSIDQMMRRVWQDFDGEEIYIFAPLVQGRKGDARKILEQCLKQAYVRIRVDGQLMKPSIIPLDKNRKHTIEALIDKVALSPDNRGRVADAIEKALQVGGGLVSVETADPVRKAIFSSKQACPICGFSIAEISPRLFSFNSPYGACPDCHGLGATLQVDLDLLIEDWTRTIDGGVFENWVPNSAQWYYAMIHAVCAQFDIPRDVPFLDIEPDKRNILLFGSGKEDLLFEYKSDRKHKVTKKPFEGIVNNIHRRYKEGASEAHQEKLEEVMSYFECQTCRGKRLNRAASGVMIANTTIHDLCSMPLNTLRDAMKELINQFTPKQLQLSEFVVKEIMDRLQFLLDIGLHYVTLDRPAYTLSGGEAQRIRLATQIGSALSGVTYVLDEPSIGLHQRDNRRLIQTLKRLRDLGNTVIVVEHDAETMAEADDIVELGPGAGEFGGQIVAQGTPDELKRMKHSLTGQYLSGTKQIRVPSGR